MTPKQIAKKLEAAGLDTAHMEIHRDEVEIWTGNENTTRRLASRVAKALGWNAGYRTGYGGQVLQPTGQNRGDWNDHTSRWHY